MKKMYLHAGLLLMGAVLMLSSCLGEGRNVQSATVYGVVRYDYKSGKTVLDISRHETLYSRAFELDATEGACHVVTYELDFDDPQNARDTVAKKGYYTAILSPRYQLSKYSISQIQQADTSVMLKDEQPILNAIVSRPSEIKNILILPHGIKQPEDQQTSWQLSFDPQNMAKVEADQLVFDLFLRATLKTPGTKSPENTTVLNAYDTEGFIDNAARRAKSDGKKDFFIRINYPGEIKDSTITWKKSDKIGFLVEYILSGAEK